MTADIEDAKVLAGHAQTTGLDRDDPLLLELADTVMALIKELELRELHHFETEQELARLRAVIQSAYNAWHMESRQAAIDILLPEVGGEPREAAP